MPYVSKEEATKYRMEYKKQHPEKERIWRRNYYLKNKEERNTYVKTHERNKPYQERSLKKWRTRNPEKVRAQRMRIRIKLLDIIGNGIIKCVRCGCDDYRFLEINHKNGGGYKENKNRKGVGSFNNSILNHERSIDDLELLCKPCNILHYIEIKFGKKGRIIWEVS